MSYNYLPGFAIYMCERLIMLTASSTNISTHCLVSYIDLQMVFAYLRTYPHLQYVPGLGHVSILPWYWHDFIHASYYFPSATYKCNHSIFWLHISRNIVPLNIITKNPA